VFPRGDVHFGFLGLGEMEDHGVLDLLAFVEEVELNERFKIRDHAKVSTAQPRFFFGLTKGRGERVFALLKVSLGEIPVTPAAVKQEIFIAFFRLAENYEARNHLGLNGLFFRFMRDDT
jgi:hypothetical protein